LSFFSSGEDSEDDADQENEDCEDEEGAEEVEDEEESDDDVGEDEDDEEENISIEEIKKTGKRKCESDEIPTKKLKVDLNEEEERVSSIKVLHKPLWPLKFQKMCQKLRSVSIFKEFSKFQCYVPSVGLPGSVVVHVD